LAVFSASATGVRGVEKLASTMGEQVPPLHPPPWQPWPQAPQLLPSVMRFAHAFGHTVVPAPQVWHWLPTHAAPAAHWLLVLQVVVQAVAPQMKGAQGVLTGPGQLPLPSQPAAAVALPPMQLAMRQGVELVGKTQLALLPLQVDAHVPVPAHDP